MNDDLFDQAKSRLAAEFDLVAPPSTRLAVSEDGALVARLDGTAEVEAFVPISWAQVDRTDTYGKLAQGLAAVALQEQGSAHLRIGPSEGYTEVADEAWHLSLAMAAGAYQERVEQNRLIEVLKASFAAIGPLPWPFTEGGSQASDLFMTGVLAGATLDWKDLKSEDEITAIAARLHATAVQRLQSELKLRR